MTNAHWESDNPRRFPTMDDQSAEALKALVAAISLLTSAVNQLIPRISGTEDPGRGTEDTGCGTEDTGHGTEDAGHGTEDTGCGPEDTGRRRKRHHRGARETFEIFVRELTGRLIPFRVDSTQRVEDVKTLIRHRLEIPEEQQRLIYAGRQLEVGHTMADYEIRPGCWLNLALRLRG
jgi:hypothetical protein